MKTYTLHLPARAAAGDAEAIERAVLVRDGFSWGAFFFSFLWFFVRRLWLAGLIVLAAIAALEEAETKSFARWLGTAPAAGPAPARLPVPAPARLRPEPVIGLFPEAER